MIQVGNWGMKMTSLVAGQAIFHSITTEVIVEVTIEVIVEVVVEVTLEVIVEVTIAFIVEIIHSLLRSLAM
jgi:hypothetical protein